MNLLMRYLKKLIYFSLVLAGLLLFIVWQNNAIGVTNYEYVDTKIPDSFQDFTILQISDLHNKEFGSGQSRLIAASREVQPDIIVVTGDLIDRIITDIPMAMAYIKEAVLIAPVYYVTGNHEHSSRVYEQLKVQLVDAGVTVLENQGVTIEREGDIISLIGVADRLTTSNDQLYKSRLRNLTGNAAADFKILLSHRPELFSWYAENDLDLVFAGHAHGGQFRLPFIGGLYAPGQGLLPQYTIGMYSKNNTSMVVSRGLGNSSIMPVRLFNSPELVVLTLKNR